MRKLIRNLDRGHRPNRNRPRLESLEGRQLMSVGAEFADTVNTTTRNAQFSSANASSANGSSVVVWTDTFSATDHDIRAQRLDSAGHKVGPEILVAASTNDEQSPSVAMDNSGNFVVAWTVTKPGGDSDVLARRFNAAGAVMGSAVQVGVGTFKEHDPSVAMDAVGNFVVAYTRDTNNNNPDVFAKRYDVNNQLLGVVNVATTAKAELRPSVAMTPDGRFDVAWEQAFSSTDHDIAISRFGASGQLIGTNVMAASTLNESRPRVAMDNFGNAVVAWQQTATGSTRIMARRLTTAGVVGTQIQIANSTSSLTAPAVALKRGGGGFVVAYNSIGAQNDVKIAEVGANDSVTTLFAGNRSDPAVSINSAGNYLLTYTSVDAGDLNIRRRIGHI